MAEMNFLIAVRMTDYKRDDDIRERLGTKDTFFFLIIPYAFFRCRIFLFYLWILLDIW
jgi:hypothetical protein